VAQPHETPRTKAGGDRRPSCLLDCCEGYHERAGAYPARVRTFAVSAIGVDRPGIIAGVAERLVAHGVNVTDSQMSILRGHFAMTLVVTAPADFDEEALAEGLAETGRELGLEAVAVRPVEDAHASALAVPELVVSVYGADHPGIVAAIAGALAGLGANVCDLRTRLVGEEEGRPVYVMLMEVALPPGTGEDELREHLFEIAREQGVEVAVAPLEPDVL
jgi:glycine cleavage system transcriptional repressor